MADDEQFSLCWNNFNTNLSAGFHESLCRGDLVDVTLAAEGQLVKAHRLVLSVCSPYFRKMFTQMPANQHAFVFLKDVSHSALKDLIQFMYCGEVNVKQDALPAFISTAEALQIKGLTETGETSAPQQSPAKESTIVPNVPSSASPRSKPQRNRIQSYKVESEESSDEKIVAHNVQVQSQKRTVQRSVTPQSMPVLKRAKITSDPLESPESTIQTVHIVKQQVQSTEPEYVELPIETINPKSEPEYVEDTSEIEAGDQEQEQEQEAHEIQEQDDAHNYVEDESYGDIKYDESYFTENDEVKAGVSGFSESYVEGDQSASEAQVTDYSAQQLKFIRSPWSTPCLIINDFIYNCHSTRGSKGYWRCHNYSRKKKEERCRARCVVVNGKLRALTGGQHNHLPHTDKIEKISKRNSMYEEVNADIKSKDDTDLETIQQESIETKIEVVDFILPTNYNL